MEANLFNPGFLGSHFSWWIGQIADDATWRDNILPGKFEDSNSLPGWGSRYKVRIIGLHDQEEEPIPSDQLPWAQVMYPVTAGGGQTNASQTANLRQGMFVFGFFLDGIEQQVPVIMGVLGNNAQTNLSFKTGMSGGKNFSPQSGYANSIQPKEGTAKERTPDEGLSTRKPSDPSQQIECSPAPPGASLDEYGLRKDIPRSPDQLRDIQEALRQSDNLSGDAKNVFIRDYVAKQAKSRCDFSQSPASPSQPGATLEANDGSKHRLNAGDVKRDKKYLEKIPLLKPDKNRVESSIKAIQTVIDNLTEKLNQYLNSASSYIEAVSSIVGNIQKVISDAACEIAKYMKIVFDKIMEYVLKILNKNLTKAVSSIPSSQRYKFADMKETFTELILCLYNKITNSLCALIQGILDELINLDDLSKNAPRDRAPKVNICNAENMVARVIGHNKDTITKANNDILKNVNTFLADTESQLSQVSGIVTQAKSIADKAKGISKSLGSIGSIGNTFQVGNISGNLTSALQFENIISNVFKCEMLMNPPVSDYYTFNRGGSGQSSIQLPSIPNIGRFVNDAKSITSGGDVPFLEPKKGQPGIIKVK